MSNHVVSMKRRGPTVVALVSMLAASADAQLLNIDLGDGAGGNGDYQGVAASGQGGTWNHINDPMQANAQLPIINADGTDTGVTFAANVATQVFDPAEGTEMLVDPDLMGDIHWNQPATVTQFTLANVQPGEYSLFIYSYAGDVINDDTVITVNGESQTVAHVGPLDPTVHAVGDTYALFFPVSPNASGEIVFEVEGGPGIPGVGNFWQINGLQLAGDPTGVPPSISFSQPNRGTDENGCCELNWTMTNANPEAAISLWYLQLEAGAGGRNPSCTGPDSITVEGDWVPTFCYPWDEGTGPSAPSSRAVICFADGGPVPPGGTVSGTIKIDVNGPVDFTEPPADPVELPYDPPNNLLVPPDGFIANVNQGPPDQPCEDGSFNAMTGESDGWSGPVFVVCLPAFLPVPALEAGGRALLLLTVSLVGVLLIRRTLVRARG